MTAFPFLTSILGNIGSEKAIDALIKNLENTDNDWQRGMVTSALIEIGKGSIPALKAIIEKSLREPIKSNNQNINSGNAALALAHLGVKDSSANILELLKKVNEDDAKGTSHWGATPGIQKDLMRALVLLGNSSAQTTFETMAKSDRVPGVIFAAEEAQKALAFVRQGKNPYDVVVPEKPLDPKRHYSRVYAKYDYYRDVETDEQIFVKRHAAGTVPFDSAARYR